MKKSGFVSGSDLLLIINGKAVGHCTSHSIDYNTETKDRQFKPVATLDADAGLWKEKGITGLSISISADGLACYDEVETGRKELLTAWHSALPVTIKAIERGEDTTPYLEGSFIITKVSESLPSGDDVTFNVSLENNGKPTIFAPSEITENKGE